MAESILITGGTGFAGSHLVEHLLATGTPAESVNVTSFSEKNSFVHGILPATNIHQLDLTDQAATAALITQLTPTQIYHLAAFSDVGGSYDQLRGVILNNLDMQLNLLEAVAQSAPQAKLLLTCSAMEYDYAVPNFDPMQGVTETHPLGPISPYALSKVFQDMTGHLYAHTHHLHIVRVRPFNHTGERQTDKFVIPAFAKQIVAIERGEQTELAVGNLDTVRDFMDVKDVVAAYQLLMDQGQTGQIYNVGSEQGYTISDLLDQLLELSSTEITVTVDTARLRPADVPVAIADATKIKALGWTPQHAITDTLSRVLKYWRNT